MERRKNKIAAKTLAELLDGSSSLYIHKPGELSPIGKCATCGAPLTAEVEEIEKRE